jgi:hypothetical protein
MRDDASTSNSQMSFSFIDAIRIGDALDSTEVLWCGEISTGDNCSISQRRCLAENEKQFYLDSNVPPQNAFDTRTEKRNARVHTKHLKTSETTPREVRDGNFRFDLFADAASHEDPSVIPSKGGMAARPTARRSFAVPRRARVRLTFDGTSGRFWQEILGKRAKKGGRVIAADLR